MRLFLRLQLSSLMGLGDAGDSVHHYLFSKYAPAHTDLFFNHWAKPLFVLLSSPFAQFGFVGVKVFNVLSSLFTIYFTYKSIQKLNLKNSIVGAIILMFSPLCFILTFSGLTEPLFALFISLGLYTLLSKRLILSCIIISFLPFIRSEGLIIIGVFALYFLYKKHWKIIPVLLFGHIAYMISGFFLYDDLLWVFNKIPYAQLDSLYGSGELSRFVEQLLYVVGIPIYVLFWVGVVAVIWKSIKKGMSSEIQILVFIGFFSFFIAHSLFWYLGIFNSMGLNRVLIGVIPLVSIISLIGFNFITEDILKGQSRLKRVFQGVLVGYILIFPFTKNPAAINFDQDLNLSKDQQTAIQTVALIKSHASLNQRYVFAHPYLSEALNIDHFDINQHLELVNEYPEHGKSGDIIIWENWFAVIEHGVTKESLVNNPNLTCIYEAKATDRNREIQYVVFQRR